MKPWRSEELPWSGWAELQSSVAKTIQNPFPFHLGSVEAWSGVFLPITVEPAELKVAGSDTPLQVASTINLKRELCEYARRRRLPTENGQLQALFEQYLDDDEKVDTDYDVQVYSQLMQAVNNSLSRKQPLWVVK